MRHGILVMGLMAISMTAFAADTSQETGLLPPLLEKAPDTAGMGKLAAAPPLSYLQVYAVYSTRYGGWEKLDPSAFYTSDHGGSQMVVAVLEIGFGGTPYVKMAGNQIPSPAFSWQGVCAFVNGVAYSCSPGQTLIGWMYYVDVSGYEGGLFEYQNTSANYPWNIMYDRVQIQ